VDINSGAAIGAGVTTPFVQSPTVEQYMRPDEGNMYHWIPILDEWLAVQFKYKGNPQLGTYKAPDGKAFDYSMGTQMLQFAVAGTPNRYIMPPTLQMMSMYERYPALSFTNRDPANPHVLTMLMFGRAYKLEKISDDELTKGPYTTLEFGLMNY
jgi:hypothetical protein